MMKCVLSGKCLKDDGEIQKNKQRGIMSIEQYDDETLLEEVKHRGFEIRLICDTVISIGGVRFDITS